MCTAKMLINTFILCTVNSIFLIAGIFLNSVAIISLWRSSVLRNSLCYFLIFVLSCFDLLVAIVNHPSIMASAIVMGYGNHDKLFQNVFEFTTTFFVVLAIGALLTLNIERFLALSYPFFHERMVTKERVVYFLVLQQFSGILLSILTFRDIILSRPMVMIFALSFVLSLFLYINCRIFIIARLKRRSGKIAPSNHREQKRTKFNLKKMSTCSLAVVCFIVCSFPEYFYWIYLLTSETQLHENTNTFRLWSGTMVGANSTFNCLILFWRNTVLRREGMKIVKKLQSRCCCFRVTRYRDT